MSGHGFHVHGPHDHELEHAAHSIAKHPSSGTIAVATAVLATVGAIFSYMGGATQANAGLYKNNAAFKKTEASNQWNYYQAKSGKQNLAEVALVLVSEDKRAGFKEEVDRYQKEKAAIKVDAEKLEAEATDWDKQSDAQMRLHHRWAQATTALQISIALAAMTLLTGRKWLEWGMFSMAGLGVALGAMALAHL